MLLFGLSFLGVNNFADGLNPLVIGVYISAIGFSLGGQRGLPSTRPGTLPRDWPILSCLYPVKVLPTGLIPGFRLWAP